MSDAADIIALVTPLLNEEQKAAISDLFEAFDEAMAEERQAERFGVALAMAPILDRSKVSFFADHVGPGDRIGAAEARDFFRRVEARVEAVCAGLHRIEASE
ncbi:hypothetical protein FSZ31_04275 [Sphingorhabdus soli]|uniref:Uncharacterized protein n=1 Tax=Flavisphingopyxis soli TaxID=2601267 RepID=A0A5C6ULH6_9SPHN|nr:hypothetical protein [Sphingorhabdus soli]TXC73943.1 hypothetical protein FSZ31_04275 [Sphingorhabdus soli]